MKEWDYYLVMSEQFGVAFTISDLGYIHMASVSFMDFEKHEECTRSVLSAPSFGFILPDQPVQGVCEWKSKDLTLRFESAPNGRHIYCEFKKFYKKSTFKADLWFSDLPDESMNIATPFDQKRHFYLNQKMNCMPCSGKIVFNWHVYQCAPERDLGVLDWGRGVWPHKINWYWATASAMVKGKPFGFNLGYGFGNTQAASENMLFYDGRSSKLEDVEFKIPADPMQPWTITSSDGRFEAIFHPDLDRADKLEAGPFYSDQHQYFGLINGTAILDDGTKISMEHLRCAIEDIKNNY